MTYQVLARKWRPRDFDSLVGQDHVVRALSHALDQQRLHHAWLFTGTRGVGKTTLSRILAKALNCETGITSRPCGVCRACMEIDAGRFVDYVEMDAASNRGVDEMAALLDRAIYAPVDARFKVYMIDEVHMLTNHAFNAMLKTLEEPPAHVKFILATTDPQKIPVTVLSRCLQFNLKQMPAGDIVTHLDKVLQAEGIVFEQQALRLLSRAADGSMRDALSLTDQAIAYSAGEVTEQAVSGMLGALDQRYLIRLLDAVVAEDGAGILAVADEMALRSLSFSIALQDLAQLLNRTAWAQFVPSSVLDEWPEAEHIRRFAGALRPEQVQLYYQIATIGRSELGLAPDEYAGFTMTLLRMLAFRPMAGGGGVASGGGSLPIASPERARAAAPAQRAATSLASAAALSPSSASLPASAPVVVAERTPVAQPDPAPPVVSPAQAAFAALGTKTPPRQDAPDAGVSVRSPATQDFESQEKTAPAAVSVPVPTASVSAPAAGGGGASASVVRNTPAGTAGAAPLSSRLMSMSGRLGAATAGPATAAATATAAVPVRPVTVKTPPSAPPVTQPRAQAADDSGDNAPPWDGAPWDDDGAQAFLSSAMPDEVAVTRPAAVPPAAERVALSRPDEDAPVEPGSLSSAHTASADTASADTASTLPSGLHMASVGFDGDWPALAATLDVKGLAQQLAFQSELTAIDGDCLVLQIPMAHLADGPHVEKVQLALAAVLPRPMRLQITSGPARVTAAALEHERKARQQRRAEQVIASDPFVQALMRDFDAAIMPGSTQPAFPAAMPGAPASLRSDVRSQARG